MFLDMLLAKHTSLALNRYQLEIKSRMVPYLLNIFKHLMPNVDPSSFLPVFDALYTECQSGFINPSGKPFILHLFIFTNHEHF